MEGKLWMMHVLSAESASTGRNSLSVFEGIKGKFKTLTEVK